MLKPLVDRVILLLPQTSLAQPTGLVGQKRKTLTPEELELRREKVKDRVGGGGGGGRGGGEGMGNREGRGRRERIPRILGKRSMRGNQRPGREMQHKREK